ncbi:response regulator [Cellulophaga sp. Hel_I_12]|uniref:response regulator n=1 Tax=Cellulophaga sp. Hel_I_12 TaxID=1249972 RepID=UPI00064783B5|nr:response regulator [Cellulophaga sp. Hel_I_12]
MGKMFENIYMIDDDPIYLFLAKKLFIEQKFSQNIKTFENGKIAIESLLNSQNLKENLPDIIFLDLNMPLMNGWEFLDSLNAAPIPNKENITIIVMSSSINPMEIDMIKSYPVVQDYIVKPLTPADLQKLLAF